MKKKTIWQNLITTAFQSESVFNNSKQHRNTDVFRLLRDLCENIRLAYMLILKFHLLSYVGGCVGYKKDHLQQHSAKFCWFSWVDVVTSTKDDGYLTLLEKNCSMQKRLLVVSNFPVFTLSPTSTFLPNS